MSANGKGCSNAAFTMLNSPVAAAIPTARETTAIAATPGLRRKLRSAYRRSTARVSSKKSPQRRARNKITTRGRGDGRAQFTSVRTCFAVRISTARRSGRCADERNTSALRNLWRRQNRFDDVHVALVAREFVELLLCSLQTNHCGPRTRRRRRVVDTDFV